MKIIQKLIIPFDDYFSNRKHCFYIPKKSRTNYRLKAVAPGGKGSAAFKGAPIAGGGGGGAGAFIDVVLDLLPGSILSGEIDSDENLRIKFVDFSGNDRTYVLQKGYTGLPATSTTSGSGGASGTGLPGGVYHATDKEQYVPHAIIDGENLGHTSGGFAGIRSFIPIGTGYLYESGLAAKTTKRASKFPVDVVKVAAQGGLGGVSFLGGPTPFWSTAIFTDAGGNIYGNIKAGFGAGGNGECGFNVLGLPLLPTIPGDALMVLEYEM